MIPRGQSVSGHVDWENAVQGLGKETARGLKIRLWPCQRRLSQRGISRPVYQPVSVLLVFVVLQESF